MTLLAAFQTLLARYTGQYDIVVGTPIANRTRTELESLIGFFVNTLALRTDLSGDPTFRELLRRVRAVALGAYAHQELPFERLVEELQPERVLGQTPLFQVMLTMQNAPRSELRLPGLTLRYLPSSTETAKFDLSLQLSENPGGALRGTFVYNRELFEDTVVARMAEHFEVLLHGIVADPDARLSALPLMTPQERGRLLVEWNAGPRHVPDGRCVHELFEARVAETPEAVAIVSGAETPTYDQLNRRANRLAHHLRELGVRQSDVVGLCLDRSVGLIVGLLGIMKANAAYLPLDPLHPGERLRFVLDDSGADLVVAEQGTAAALPVEPARVVCLNSAGDLPGEPGADPEREANPVLTALDGDLAYVLYTSGSTGRPKGVMVEHRSVANYLAWVNDHLFDDGVRTVPMITGLTFDASLKQALAPLVRGGAVWILPREVVAEPVALLRALDATEGVGINCVPSAWGTILGAHESSGSTEPVRGPVSLMLGGESIPDELLRRTRAVFPALRIWNLYGPTETTANAAAARLSGDRVVIGRPAAGARLYVLDRHLQPVPTGVAGELCVGGAGVARGYLGRPGLTAERFIPDPFGAVSGARLYRTGDQVRWRSDGELEYLGRLDDQVKLRGHRIELGEIEAVLAGGAGVRECVVLLREDAPDERRLVAYVVGERGDPAVRAREWREHLKRKLPDYMVPVVFVPLEALPLTPTGKVDRRSLPAPERSPPTEGFVAPRTPTETQMAGIWMAVLRLDRVDARDDFFALGGHSLLATQVVSRVRETFGVELPLRAVFETPGLADLAQRVEQAPRTAAAPTPDPPLVRAPRIPYSRQRP
jgi:amino acid adenylation domain-containing protein